MIHFFQNLNKIYLVEAKSTLSEETQSKLSWLFAGAKYLKTDHCEGIFIGPRATMITPWSTNAVEITQNMGIDNISRIEEFIVADASFEHFDPMLFQKYNGLSQHIFSVDIKPDPVLEIDDIASYNQQEGLALSSDEITYLKHLSQKLGRKLTDSEIFGFSQVNSEHCRHKIFNGIFNIDNQDKPLSLFQLIRKTSETHPNEIVSAYKDNVAFLNGPVAVQFAPKSSDKADFYTEKPFQSLISLKAETHNFPTTVEPFNGAATGSGGEIRDRLAGGTGSLPLAGTAVYMTSYSRIIPNRKWEDIVKQRQWLYQSPIDILIKASNGASDFGNKFGQPLICGSVFTFEHQEQQQKYGFDKVIMLAGGIGYGKQEMAQKKTPQKGDKIVVLGGENYRIGMGGAAVSSADTGAFGSGIELNAIQRSNPEMQKRVANTIRAVVEGVYNPIVSIHDHGAGGHLNCLSELIEETGGKIIIDKLPVGDPTLSTKEILGNESQERIGLVIKNNDIEALEKIAQRERAPLYVVGEVTDDKKFRCVYETKSEKPIDMQLSDMFGNSPKTIIKDVTTPLLFSDVSTENIPIETLLSQVLQLESVGCKDWLTNKVDRCVGGRVAKQQCVGVLQLPLNNVGVMALDFKGKHGIATSIGHSSISALISPESGSRNAVAEALSNIIWAPLHKGIKSVSLSANWMWPCNNPGEDARLYKAVEACSNFAIDLGINIPTGKDSLSMTQKYPNESVIAPGTVIISAVGQCSDIKKVVEPVIQKNGGSIYYIHLSQDNFHLGGSALYQTLGSVGSKAPDIKNATFFKNAFNAIQNLIEEQEIVAGHDIGSGGLITTLLEMCFSHSEPVSMKLNLTELSKKWGQNSLTHTLFSENIGLVIQAKNDSTLERILDENQVSFFKLGEIVLSENLNITHHKENLQLNISHYRDIWFETSMHLDEHQTQNGLATVRYNNYKHQPLTYLFPKHFTGKLSSFEGKHRPKAAVIREKGSNSEREMAHAMFLAGFDVKDIHMTDLISGKETLEDIQFIGAVGGFSNSDVLGSAKGWAGAFLFNEKAQKALQNFFKREDTLSVGICNGCQLFMELELIHPELPIHGKMVQNNSKKHESNFTSVVIEKNNSIMLSSLEGSRLGVWISHGEGKFQLPLSKENYNIVATYGYDDYPSNPNGSDYNVAMLCDKTGRHLVTMPHIERSIFPWNWAYYPNTSDDVSPWIEAFINARKWIESKQK